MSGGLIEGLDFESSIDRLVAAFFLRAGLPCCLAWGHGKYGKDQEFMLRQDMVVSFLEWGGAKPQDENISSINVSAGLRVKKDLQGDIHINCLTYERSEGFYDYTIGVESGKISDTRKSLIFKFGPRIFY